MNKLPSSVTSHKGMLSQKVTSLILVMISAGNAVALAEKKGCDLADLSLEELQAIHPDITKGVFDVLSVEASVASRTSFGGTAPSEVKKQIAWWRGRN